MSYLIDTNVISELVKPVPAVGVESWARSIPNDLRYLSVLTIGELRRGINRLPLSTKRERLGVWLETELPEQFAKRILPVDIEVADRWGRVTATALRTLPAIDGLLAATALCHGLTLVTRNVKDFDVPGLDVLDPWDMG